MKAEIIIDGILVKLEGVEEGEFLTITTTLKNISVEKKVLTFPNSGKLKSMLKTKESFHHYYQNIEEPLMYAQSLLKHSLEIQEEMKETFTFKKIKEVEKEELIVFLCYGGHTVRMRIN